MRDCRLAAPSALEAALGQLREELLPIRVSGRVESLNNRTADGWIVTLVNNEGITKTYQKAPRKSLPFVTRKLRRYQPHFSARRKVIKPSIL